jgi:hypothetical protein
MLGELDGEAAMRRAVQTGTEPLDHLARDELESAERRQLLRLEEVRAPAPA